MCQFTSLLTEHFDLIPKGIRIPYEKVFRLYFPFPLSFGLQNTGSHFSIFIILTEFISHQLILQTHPGVIYIRDSGKFMGTATQVLVFRVIFCARFVTVVTTSSNSPLVTSRRRNNKPVKHLFPSLWVFRLGNKPVDLDRFWERDIDGR